MENLKNFALAYLLLNWAKPSLIICNKDLKLVTPKNLGVELPCASQHSLPAASASALANVSFL